jgi:hypothetical protein
MPLFVPISWGELLDKISILELKSQRMRTPAMLANVQRELTALVTVRDAHPTWSKAEEETAELERVNGELWDIEDEIRACEKESEFGPKFVALARRVYLVNDRRAAIKRKINDRLGSELVEEKMYRE